MPSLRKTLPAAAAAAALALGGVSAQAAPSRPARPPRLFTPTHHVVLTVHHFTGEGGQDTWVEFDPAIYLKAIGDRFEIDVRRPDFHHGLRATVHVDGHERRLPRRFLRGWNGLRRAFTLTWRTPGGRQITRSTAPWCPNDGDASRLSPYAAQDTAFLAECGGFNPFIRSQRWGIDRGWARRVLPYGIDAPDAVALGDHAVLEVALRKGLGRRLGITASSRTVRFDVTVRNVTDTDGGEGIAPTPTSPETPRAALRAASSSRLSPARPRVTAARPPVSALPDLVPLPAFGMSTSNEGGHDLLGFAATVYNGGRGPLVAEGFRRGSAAVMDAYQSFYRDDRLVGSRKVGTMAYDARKSHQHWHFKDFARYDLVTRAGHRLRTSGKEAFCLAPTDAIDLLMRGAVVDPGDGDLSTACGDASSIWVREVLASGWGDTYTQERAGQAIDITGLPNGTYWVRVTANPAGRLVESSRRNDVSLRRVILGGSPGDRTVRVPAYGVIDSEAHQQQFFRHATTD